MKKSIAEVFLPLFEEGLAQIDKIENPTRADFEKVFRPVFNAIAMIFHDDGLVRLTPRMRDWLRGLIGWMEHGYRLKSSLSAAEESRRSVDAIKEFILDYGRVPPRRSFPNRFSANAMTFRRNREKVNLVGRESHESF